MITSRYQRAVRNLGGFAGGTSRLARPPAPELEIDVRPGGTCPERVFTDLYTWPFYFFAGPTPDGSLLWTLAPEEFDPDTFYARSYTSTTLALSATLGPFDRVTDLGGPPTSGGGATYATDGDYLYFIGETTGPNVHTLHRVDLSSSVVSSLHAFDADDFVIFVAYCHLDGRLYLTYYDDSAGSITLRAINVDGTGFSTLTSALGSDVGNPVWAAGHVWIMGDATLYAYNISTTGVSTQTPTLDASAGELLISNGSIVGRYGADSNLNHFWTYTLSGETTVNDGVAAVLYDPYLNGNYLPLTVDGGGCGEFMFSGDIDGGGTVSGAPFAAKQQASGVSWFHGSYGTYANYWRFS